MHLWFRFLEIWSTEFRNTTSLPNVEWQRGRSYQVLLPVF